MTAAFVDLLEWAAFGSSLLCVFLYGYGRVVGGVAGIATALLFIGWGFAAGIAAAAYINIAFLVLHIRNLLRGLGARGRPC